MSEVSARPPAVEQQVLDDLRARLRGFRPVESARESGWDRGVPREYLAELIRYWTDHYEWREHEQRIAELPWVVAGLDATPLRAVHQRVDTEDPITVVLLHGWPDSVLRFEKVLPLLQDVDVVVPALPGFPFAAPVPGHGMPAAEMADLLAAALEETGSRRWVVSAGDVGHHVAAALASAYPGRVAGLHLTDVSQQRFLVDPPGDLTATEQAYVRHGHRWQAAEGGYMHEQRTRPQTLAVGLGDSPAGLLAWIVEKLRSWTDCGGDVERVFTRDELLTWVTAYWVSGAIGTSFAPYALAGPTPIGRIATPTVFTVFPHDLVNAPEEFAARFFNVVSWTQESAGGHFAAWEQPAAYAAGVRTAIAHARANS